MKQTNPERWQAVWERSAEKAVSLGLSPEMVAQTMTAAGMRLMLSVCGPAAMAYWLGRLAYEYEQAAGGPEAVAQAVNPEEQPEPRRVH
jgi:hypothetical protein